MNEVKDTSLNAFFDVKEDGTQSIQLQQIYKAIFDNPHGLIFPEIEDLTNIQKSSVTARVNRLCKLNKVEDSGVKKINPYSGKNNIVWVVKYG